GKVNFATIDAKAFGQHAGNLNLEVGKWPAFAIQDTQKNQKFPFEGTDLSTKKITKFLDDFVAGKVEPSIKSEPIPEKNDGPVTVIVAKNYDEIVMNADKDVLVEFYAPWCGHCKSLAPKYEELGELFKPHSNKVTIAKVDATANDVPDEIQGFPTIKLFPAHGKGEPIEYSGARTVEDLATFIRENGSNKVDADASSDDVETAGMPKQAEAATEGVAAKVAGAVKDAVVEKAGEAAAVVKDGLVDSDGDLAEHDEL
ncbi:disulfide isomerase PDI1 protein, partial [Aureobasidium melanogenum]